MNHRIVTPIRHRPLEQSWVLGRTRDFEQDDDFDIDNNSKSSSFQCSAFNPQQERDRSDEEANDVVVRSSFYVKGICCASEIPAIRKIVRRFPGV